MIANNCLVATSQPLAAQAGLRTLMAGGNAIDAAVATLNVVEPMSTGVLAALGHDVISANGFGGGQMIVIVPESGALLGGADLRGWLRDRVLTMRPGRILSGT